VTGSLVPPTKPWSPAQVEGWVPRALPNGLWFYPTVSFGTLGAPVKLAATGWKAMDLMSPGDTAGTGKPGLWTRNRTTGDIDSYTLTTGTTDTDANGDPLDEPAPVVTAVSTARRSATWSPPTTRSSAPTATSPGTASPTCGRSPAPAASTSGRAPPRPAARVRR
jgi:hypothetical protein